MMHFKAFVYSFFLTTAFILITGSKLLAQEPVKPAVDKDSTQINFQEEGLIVTVDQPDSLSIETVKIPDKVDPRKAAFYSAILPGLGQAYNKAYWKIPIIYTGGAVFVYAVTNYNRLYSESLKNLNTFNLNPDTPPINNRGKDFYQRNADYYRRQRDYFIILGTVWYGLNIVEAMVDAHLQYFDLSDDLALKVKPSLSNPAAFGQMNAGISLTLQLK